MKITLFKITKKNTFLFLAVILMFFLFILVSCKENETGDVEEALFYSEFGARGDGVTDDFDAIIATHTEANLRGIKVKADKNAIYYIGDAKKTAIIQTDTDWGDTQFIIDDSDVDDNRSSWIFKITSALKFSEKLKPMQSLRKGQKNIGVSLEHPALVVAIDKNVKQYIRAGSTPTDGSSQRDVFKVDRNGNVSKDTPILLEFENVTSLEMHPIDTTPLNISGGRFTTIANKYAAENGYFARGIQVSRSNTTIDGITHHVRGEGDIGYGYNGFINIMLASDITLKNSVLSGRKLYYKENDPLRTVASYDFIAHSALNITVKDCSQANFIEDATYWGIMGSNYCKNFVFDNVHWSRFDAHQGVHNATIKNSVLHTVAVIGSGKLHMENTTVNGKNFITFRSDYGSHWDGEVFIKNCIFSPPRGYINPSSNMAVVFNMLNNGNHYFGYDAKMPETIIIDGLRIEDNINDEKYKGVRLFSNYNMKLTGNEPYPYQITKVIKTRNLVTTSGLEYIIPNAYLRENLIIKDYNPLLATHIIAISATILVIGLTITILLVSKRKKMKR